ncbi:MAG TPA: hypothetical protein VGN14_05720 [Candidatus Elarobacter sp.]|jgi:hypothetical protein
MIVLRVVRLAALACGTFVAAAALTSVPAHAAACNTITSVKNSAPLTANKAAGGHVKQHVLGETQGADDPQTGKTLFADGAKYAAAWRQYGYYGTVACSGRAVSQEMTLTQLHMGFLDAYSCTASNPNGSCKTKTLYMAHSIFYGFILRGSTWILNTAYPVPLTAMRH